MSNSIFQSVQTRKLPYNNFPLSREVLLSGQIGKLIPVQCDEVVPGDRFQQNVAFLTRFTPLSAPAMARFNVHFHTFYVPYRIITAETSKESTYEKFIKSIGKHEEDVPTLPYIYGTVGSKPSMGGTVNGLPIENFNVGSLIDYLGYAVTPSAEGNAQVSSFDIPQEARLSALPLLAYQRIYQDFYRRDQIEKETVFPCDIHSINLTSGIYEDAEWDDIDDTVEMATVEDLFKLQTRNYERDYFTSALPEPQFGDEVSVGDGSVNWIGTIPGPIGFSYNGSFGLFGSSSQLGDVSLETVGYRTQLVPNGEVPLGSPNFNATMHGTATVNNSLGEWIAPGLQANTFTINDFRLAMQLQGIKEKINRVGTRYLEIMEGIYGVRVPDARLQRPIFLGGIKNPVTIGSVMQTSETDNTPQGTLTGQMSSSGTGNLIRGGYEFKEHGYIITIMSMTPRTSYFGGIPRKFMKRYPEEFYLPDFDHLGEQPVYDYELYTNYEDLSSNEPFTKEDGSPAGTNGVFGYQLRYAEYKSAQSTVHGEFRTTLANWHVSRDFSQAPALNSDFIKAEPQDFDRIFAFQDVAGTSNEHFQMQIYLDVVAKRRMSKYSTPYTLY